jgi:hypothetical protein
MPASFAEMQLRQQPWPVVGEAHDGAATTTDGGLEARKPGGGRVSDAAAEAKADDAERPDILYRLDRGLGVAQHRGQVGIGDELARDRDFIAE